MFKKNNYGIIRHASNHRGTDRLTKEGIFDAKIVAEKIKNFIVKNNFKEVVIYHSPKMRVIKTAFLLKVAMDSMIKGEIMELLFLRDESINISNNIIQKVTSDPEIFYIFVTHEPNIILFLAKKGIRENIVNSFFWSNNTIIKPKKH